MNYVQDINKEDEEKHTESGTLRSASICAIADMISEWCRSNPVVSLSARSSPRREAARYNASDGPLREHSQLSP